MKIGCARVKRSMMRGRMGIMRERRRGDGVAVEVSVGEGST